MSVSPNLDHRNGLIASNSVSKSLIWTLSLLAAAWLLVFNQQRLEWTVNPVYSYGWAVPFLAGYLIWERWKRRPKVVTTTSPSIVRVLVIALLALYLPVRIIQEANPDWVKINWAMATIAAAMTLVAFSAIGGKRYVWHFAFPIFFCYTALPWPVWMEDYLVQNLMKFNADACAEILTMFGVPALAKGNLIQVANTWVNVEEACSGIRSLQTAFMMSLFLGEFHRLKTLPRIGLLFSSFAVAFIINLVRTLVLTHFSTQGTAEKWHDTVGNVAMIACLVVLWLLSEFFSKFYQSSAGSNSQPLELRVPIIASTLCAAGIVWLIATETLSVGWYRYHETQAPNALEWNAQWPVTAANFKEIPFGERTKALLKYNDAKSVQWTTDDGYFWQMYYIRWEPGRVSKFLSTAHYPTVCLPASGLTLVSETGAWDYQVGPVNFPFSTYLFDEGGQDVYVFHAIVEDRRPEDGERLKYYQVSSSERIASVLRGQRNLGQRVIGISIRGPSTPSDAKKTVETTLTSIINVLPPPTTKS